MESGHFDQNPAPAAHPSEPAEAASNLPAAVNVGNIGASELIDGRPLDAVADDEKSANDLLDLGFSETPIASMSGGHTISPHLHDDSGHVEVHGHDDHDDGIHHIEEKNTGGVSVLDSSPPDAHLGNISGRDSPPVHENTEPIATAPGQNDREDLDGFPARSAAPSDHTADSPDRSSDPVGDFSYDSGVLEPSNSKPGSEFPSHTMESTPKASELISLDDDSDPGTAESATGGVAGAATPTAEPETDTFPEHETIVSNIHSDSKTDAFHVPDPDPTPSYTAPESFSSSHRTPSSNVASDILQPQPPPEPAMLGDHKLSGMPSTSSLDVEPPTPTHHSDGEEIEHLEHPEEEEEEEEDQEQHVPPPPFNVQRVQEVDIPPAPEKPLPPTPGEEVVKTVGDHYKTAPAAFSVKSGLGIGKMTVMEILLWRDPKKSGAALAVGLVVLVSMLYFSFISVVAYLSLALLTVTLGFRLYKTIMAAVQKTSDGHPFQDLLSVDTAVSEEQSNEMASKMVSHVNCCSSTLKDLFLVKDVFESVKFGFALYLLTYVGACFNTMTLIIMGYVAAFSLPKVYEMNKEQIDQVLGQVKDKMADISGKVKAAIPMGKKTEAPAAETTEHTKEE